MTPTQILVQDHDLILRVLDAAEREVQYIDQHVSVRAERVEKMTDFFRNFADRCHHAREEKRLFPMMQKRGMPVDGGPIAVMLQDHDIGRNHIGNVIRALPQARAGNSLEIEAVKENLSAFVTMLRMHIMKENNVLFPMADRMLSPEDQQQLLQEFAEAERNEIGKEVIAQYHQMAEELAKG